MMNADESMKLLRKLKACDEFQTWAKGKDMSTIWNTCERADWLNWLLDAIGYKWSSESWYEYRSVWSPAMVEYWRIWAPAIRDLVAYPEELLKQVESR